MQVKNLDLGDKGELKKLAQQKEDVGELSATDERKYRSLQRATERELLQVTPQTIGLDSRQGSHWHQEFLLESVRPLCVGTCVFSRQSLQCSCKVKRAVPADSLQTLSQCPWTRLVKEACWQPAVAGVKEKGCDGHVCAGG